MPSKRPFKPGMKTRYKPGRFTDERKAWVETSIGTIILQIFKYTGSTATQDTDEDSDDTEVYDAISIDAERTDTIRVYFPARGGRPLSINVTSMTEEELLHVAHFFKAVFEIALPLVRERDRMAQDAFNQGDDSFARNYRPVPRLIVRAREVGGDAERVLLRLAEVFGGDRGTGNLIRRLRGDSYELAPGKSEEGGPQDDGPKADES